MIRKWKIKLIFCLCILIILTLSYIAYLMLNKPSIVLQENVKVEIHDSPDPLKFIKSFHHVKRGDIQVGKLDTSTLGTHELLYHVAEQSYTLTYKVVDTITPVVETKDINVYIPDVVKPEDFIAKIDDASKTTVRFDKTYTFDKVGDVHVVLIVEDQGKNTTKTNATAHVMKDSEPPVLYNIENRAMMAGEPIDVLKGVYAQDNRDGKVDVKVDKQQLDTQRPGSYKIRYEAIDKAGNKTSVPCTITVLPKGDTSKIMYLTIDDGPSSSTPKILDILKQFDVKATFFVTGQDPLNFAYIKRAYEEGHAIGLHTYSHDYARVYASEQAYFDDLSKIAAVVKEQTGSIPNIIRFPGGSSNTISSQYSKGIMTSLAKSVQTKGYQYYDWNCASGDGDYSLSASTLLQTTKTCGVNGPLMLLTHDHAGSKASVDALPAILTYYKSLGFTFETITSAVPGFHQTIKN